MKAKKWQHVIRLDDPGAPPNQTTCLCFPWTREIWGSDSQSLQQVYVPLTPHLALVLPAHIKIKYSHLIIKLWLFLLLYNILILHVY